MMILIPEHKNKATYWYIYIYMWYTCFDVFTIHQSSVLALLSQCSGYLFILFVRTSMAICSCLGAASHIKSCLVDRRSERKMFRSRMYCWGIDQGPQIDRFLVVFFLFVRPLTGTRWCPQLSLSWLRQLLYALWQIYRYWFMGVT